MHLFASALLLRRSLGRSFTSIIHLLKFQSASPARLALFLYQTGPMADISTLSRIIFGTHVYSISLTAVSTL